MSALNGKRGGSTILQSTTPITRSNRAISVTSSASSGRKSWRSYLNLVEHVGARKFHRPKNLTSKTFAVAIFSKYKFPIHHCSNSFILMYLCEIRLDGFRKDTSRQMNWNNDEFCESSSDHLNYRDKIMFAFIIMGCWTFCLLCRESNASGRAVNVRASLRTRDSIQWKYHREQSCGSSC